MIHARVAPVEIPIRSTGPPVSGHQPLKAYTMVKAVWKECVIAESAHVREMDGSVDFPGAALRVDLPEPGARRSVCPKKGEAHDDHILVGDDGNVDAARRYPDPKPSAARIAEHIAFWRGVTVER